MLQVASQRESTLAVKIVINLLDDATRCVMNRVKSTACLTDVTVSTVPECVATCMQAMCFALILFAVMTLMT